jgi:hypothetical protein
MVSLLFSVTFTVLDEHTLAYTNAAKHSIAFITDSGANKLGCLPKASPHSQAGKKNVGTNTLAYFGDDV